jgi:hypothetical protein
VTSMLTVSTDVRHGNITNGGQQRRSSGHPSLLATVARCKDV